jgi:hypothetical protein
MGDSGGVAVVDERARVVDEAQVLAGLAARYVGDAWGFLTHVRSETGFGRAGAAVRTADAIAMGLWPSRGLELHGHEIKVARSDWLRELRAGAKAEEIARYCDRWWIVTTPGVVADVDGELPANWGLMELVGCRVKVRVKAPKLDPEPMSRAFMASLFRCLHEVASPAAAVEAGHARGFKDGQVAMEDALRWIRDENDRLKSQLAAFEAASGVRIDQWGDMAAVGVAVKQVLSGEGGRARGRLILLRDQAMRVARELDVAIGVDELSDAADRGQPNEGAAGVERTGEEAS